MLDRSTGAAAKARSLRTAVRAAAGLALAGSMAVPLVRRRLRVPAPVTIAATAAGPFALAVLLPRTKARDAALFGLQMWAFTVIHELPYDDPERLRRRLHVRYPIRVDRVLGLGELPNVRLQRAFSRPGEVTALDRVLAIVHWAWFVEPHLALLWILVRREERFARAGSADGGGLRPGVRRLLRRPHGAAVVGRRAGIHRTRSWEMAAPRPSRGRSRRACGG